MVNKVEHLVAKEPDFFSGGNEYADNVIMIITFTRSPTPKNKWMHELNVFLWHPSLQCGKYWVVIKYLLKCNFMFKCSAGTSRNVQVLHLQTSVQRRVYNVVSQLILTCDDNGTSHALQQMVQHCNEELQLPLFQWLLFWQVSFDIWEDHDKTPPSYKMT